MNTLCTGLGFAILLCDLDPLVQLSTVVHTHTHRNGMELFYIILMYIYIRHIDNVLISI